MKEFHGLSNTRLYSIWTHMKQRCYNENKNSFENYGGKGITVCEEWRSSFINFYTWAISNGYKETLTIDRIDVEGNYEPSNCRWADACTQQANTRKLHSTNKSGYRGVSWNKNLNKWEVSIKTENQTIKIGYYKDKLQAAKAYDTYVLDNKLPHTINRVLEIDERVDSNIGQILSEANTSGFVGVNSPKRIQHMKNPWVAAIDKKKKKVWSGYFPSALEAAIAREQYIIGNDLPNKRNFSEKEWEEIQESLKEKDEKTN